MFFADCFVLRITKATLSTGQIFVRDDEVNSVLKKKVEWAGDDVLFLLRWKVDKLSHQRRPLPRPTKRQKTVQQQSPRRGFQTAVIKTKS